jgi:hypothetical protein
MYSSGCDNLDQSGVGTAPRYWRPLLDIVGVIFVLYSETSYNHGQPPETSSGRIVILVMGIINYVNFAGLGPALLGDVMYLTLACDQIRMSAFHLCVWGAP